MSIKDRKPKKPGELTTTGPSTAKGGALAARTGGLTQAYDKAPARVSDAALAKVTQPKKGTGNIGIGLDLTNSRSEQIEAVMKAMKNILSQLKSYPVHLRTIVHQGGRISYDSAQKHNGWVSDPLMISRDISGMGTQQGVTCWESTILSFIEDPHGRDPNILIISCDCLEEYSGSILALAEPLKAKGIRVLVTYQENGDEDAKTTFKKLADLTGGLFVNMKDGLDLSEVLDFAVQAAGSDQLESLDAAAKRLGHGQLLLDYKG